MLVVTCLICFIRIMPILAHDYLLVIMLWSPYVDSLLFYKSCYSDGYNMLVCFVNHPNFNSHVYHLILFSIYV
jgi:hypothetical protein